MGRITVMATIAVAINTAIAIVILRLSSSPARYVTSLAVITAVIVLGLAMPARHRVLFYVAAIPEFVLGFLGMFTLGLPLVGASVLLLAAAETPAGRPGLGDQRAGRSALDSTVLQPCRTRSCGQALPAILGSVDLTAGGSAQRAWQLISL